MSALLALLLAVTAGHVQFDSGTGIEWRSAPQLGNATTMYRPEMEVICIERWGDRCKRFTVLTGRRQIQEVVADPGLAGMLTHELAHVWDGMDDGYFNGSRGHPYSDRIAREFYGPGNPDAPVCLSNISEWYACETARTGETR